MSRIGAISYVLGEPRDIGEIPELRADPALLDVLRGRGLVHFTQRQEPSVDMLARSIEQTLVNWSRPRSEVDLVLCVTDTLVGDPLYTLPAMNNLLVRLGLHQAFPLGVALSECNNVFSAISIASKLVTSGQFRNAMIAIVDAVEPSGNQPQRYLELASTVLSDAAASCIVGETGVYDIVGLGHYTQPQIGRVETPEQVQAFFNTHAIGVKHAVEQALTSTGKRPSDVARLFMVNYPTNIQRVYLRHSGFKSEQAFFENVARCGHAFAMDLLINLADFERTRGLSTGETCLLLSNSPTTFGAVLLEKT